MNIKTEKKVFYFMVSAAIAFSLIVITGTVWAAMMDKDNTGVRPKLEDPSPIVPLNDCGEYQYSNCQYDYNWCQQFRDPSRCWSYVGSCVNGGGTSTSCRQRCAQYGINCQSPQ